MGLTDEPVGWIILVILVVLVLRGLCKREAKDDEHSKPENWR